MFLVSGGEQSFTVMDPQEEKEAIRRLVLRLQDGDASAFSELVEKTQNRALRLGYSVSQDAHLSQDAVQDSYVSVFKSIRQLKDPSAFESWFSRIVVNRCKRLLRGRRPDSLDEAVQKGKGPSTDGMEEKTGRRLALRKAMLQLTDTDRTILSLREVAGYTYEEIANILGIQIGTVKSRIANARRRLLKAYDV